MPRAHRGPVQIALPGARECASCPQPAAPRSNLCTDCATALEHMLDPTWDGDPHRRIPASIPVYWTRLDPTPGRGGGGQRRAPGFVSNPPCSLDPVVLRDPRSKPHAVVDVWFTRLPNGRDATTKPHYEQHDAARPVEVALANLSTEIADRHRVHGPQLPNGDVAPGGVPALAGWLHHHRALLVRDPAAGGIHASLTELLHDLQVACRDVPEKPAGRCARWLPRPRGERVLCDGPVYRAVPRPGQDDDDVRAQCERCGHPYGVLDLYRMKRAHEQLEPAERAG